MSKPLAIIVDIDGTVADKGTRNPYDYTKVAEDELIWPIAVLVQQLARTGRYYVLFVSGRSDDCREATANWLGAHALTVDELHMRESRDYRPDEVVKREIYERFIEPVYDVKYVLDDRNKVVRMWRELGLTVLQVAEGDF